MQSLPTNDSANGVSFTVSDFLEAGRERLLLRAVVSGRGLARVVEEPVVNRPGLALTGFFNDFAWGRLQIMGNAECAYMDSLDAPTRRERFGALVERKAHVFVFTDGHEPEGEVVEIAEKAGAAVLATTLPTKVFTHQATFILENLGAPRASIYGTMIEVCGLGVLIEGEPGLGKSETALGLIKRGSALIADDLTCVRKDVSTNSLFGSASESTQGYMEIRGIGILHVPSVFGIDSIRGEKQLQLVITFRPLREIRGDVDRIGQTRRTRTLLGVEIPNIIIPVSEGRDLVNLVETAAQQQKLIMAGNDPVARLSERLHRRAETPKAEKWKGKRHG